jgi:hypothetical protein
MYTTHAQCIYVFRMTEITNSYHLPKSIVKLIFVKATDCMELKLFIYCWVQTVFLYRIRQYQTVGRKVDWEGRRKLKIRWCTSYEYDTNLYLTVMLASRVLTTWQVRRNGVALCWTPDSSVCFRKVRPATGHLDKPTARGFPGSTVLPGASQVPLPI